MATATEPTSLRSGDSASWSRTVEDYGPGAGWTLSYALVPRTAAGVKHSVIGVANGDGWDLTLSAADTAALSSGPYTLVGVVTKGSDRRTIYSGACEVLPDLMQASAIDTRSDAQKIIESIDAWLANRAGWAGEKMVADRKIKQHPMPELIALRQHYEGILARERELAAFAAGRPYIPGRAVVRM